MRTASSSTCGHPRWTMASATAFRPMPACDAPRSPPLRAWTPRLASSPAPGSLAAEGVNRRSESGSHGYTDTRFRQFNTTRETLSEVLDNAEGANNAP
jgi:hypothetical protein